MKRLFAKNNLIADFKKQAKKQDEEKKDTEE